MHSLHCSVLVYIWALLGLEGLSLTIVECLIFGSTLSATDPVTIVCRLSRIASLWLLQLLTTQHCTLFPLATVSDLQPTQSRSEALQYNIRRKHLERCCGNRHVRVRCSFLPSLERCRLTGSPNLYCTSQNAISVPWREDPSFVFLSRRRHISADFHDIDGVGSCFRTRMLLDAETFSA